MITSLFFAYLKLEALLITCCIYTELVRPVEGVAGARVVR